MALLDARYFSKALQKATAANVIFPETGAAGPFPVFYLLHGLSDDHTMWQRRTSIERYVQNLPLIVVMPDGGRGFGFTGAHFHKNWGDENFRKTVLNAILWIAKSEVPAEGVQSSVTPEQLRANLDAKGARK